MNVTKSCGMRIGNVIFKYNEDKTKLIGVADNGFRSFAYLRKGGLIADAKRSILYDYEKYKKMKK